MKTDKNNALKNPKPIGPNFVKHFLGEGWTHIKTVVDITHEPVLVLSEDFSIIAGNDSFYRTFRVKPKETENKIIFELGNGQWNIMALRKLLAKIIPKHTFFKGFEVSHDFPSIGQRVMLLNARRVHFSNKSTADLFPQIILLGIEDVTEMITVAETITGRVK